MAAYALMIATTSTIASGTVFNSLLGVSTTVAILLAGGVVVLYCVTGGMWSLTLTDIIQFGIMTVGIFGLLLPFAISEAGGLGGMRDTLPASYFEPTAIGWNTIFTYFLLFFFGLMIGQDIWQRIFTGRDEKVIRRGTIFAGRLLHRLRHRGRADRRRGQGRAAAAGEPGRGVRADRRGRAAERHHRAGAGRRAGGDHVDRVRRAARLLDDPGQRPADARPPGRRTRCWRRGSRRSSSASRSSACRSCSTTSSAR